MLGFLLGLAVLPFAIWGGILLLSLILGITSAVFTAIADFFKSQN